MALRLGAPFLVSQRKKASSLRRWGIFISSGAALLEERNKYMENRIAMISIIVEDAASVEALNNLLHDNSRYIIGRMGIPYREAGVNLIAVAIDAPLDTINSLTGRLGRLAGVSAKAACSNVKR